MVPNLATNGANSPNVENGDTCAENVVCALVSWVEFCSYIAKGMSVGVL